MIHLIDDTPQEMLQRYLRIEDYRDVLTRMEVIDAGMLAELKDSDCILIHSSYHDAQMKKKVIIMADYGDEIPLVNFSDGDLPEAEWDGDRCITAFKKTAMYSFLPIFLSSYRHSGKVDLKVLSDGEHYMRKEASSLATAILTPLMFLGDKAKTVLNGEQSLALKEFLSLSQPEIGISFDDVQEELPSMSVGEFRIQINKIVDDFNRYGKNIHSWR